MMRVSRGSCGVILEAIGEDQVFRPTFDLRFEELGPDSKETNVRSV